MRVGLWALLQLLLSLPIHPANFLNGVASTRPRRMTLRLRLRLQLLLVV